MLPLGAGKVVRTYSRHRKHSLYDEEPPTKRRRVDETRTTDEKLHAKDTILRPPSTSSPTRDDPAIPPCSPAEQAVIFSDGQLPSTPPTSPVRQTSSPTPVRRRPMFSFLKRRAKPDTPAKQPLLERSQNIPNPPNHSKKKRLVQMQLDLAAEVSKTCKVCGMEYIPSHADDAALHRKFHNMNIGGVDITRALSERLKKNQVWAGGDRSFIAVVSRRDMLALRNKASEVLKVVNRELGAVPIADDVLWSRLRNSIAAEAVGQQGKAQQPRKGNGDGSASDRFKAYLYVHGQKCVGACLAERIQEAFPVLDQDDASESPGRLPADSCGSSISIGNTPEAAILGVSRIWTSNLHRKHGIATRLLDSARSDFLYGMTIDKGRVAFSQPTESGGQLARKWFGRRAGWHVYLD